MLNALRHHGDGVCQTSGTTCTDDSVLTCSCSGSVSGIDCQATYAGLGVAAAGACSMACNTSQQSQNCGWPGCLSGGGGCLGMKAYQGYCLPKPTDCPPTNQPVCGCDSKTYGFACLALAAGTSVFAQGACPADF